MKLNKGNKEANLKVQIAPLIDIVFLLLVYFMVTATILRKEGNVAFRLPAPDISPPIALPVEARIHIAADGVVSVDGIRYAKTDYKLHDLAARVAGLKRMAAYQHSAFLVTLDPDRDALHSRVVGVLDACAVAKVKHLTFASRDT